MAEQELPRLAQTALDLDLPYSTSDQDWGIQHANPARIAEFITYYRQHSARFDNAQRDGVAELLLASVNDAIVEGYSDAAFLPTVFELLVEDQHYDVIRWQLAYWSGLHLDEEAVGTDEVFPISRLLGQLIQQKT